MPKYLELDVSLVDVKPRVWRRFLIRSTRSFQDLHRAIQDACDWEDCHLFDFRESRSRNVIAMLKSSSVLADLVDDDVPDAKKVKLSTYFAEKGDKCIYLYDFGDGWEHLVKLKAIVETPEKFVRRLLDGGRAFPLEDCGGIWGYENCVAILKMTDAQIDKLDDDERDELLWRREWMGDEWDPEQFDLQETKKQFDR